MIYRATTCKTPTVRPIDWDREEAYSSRWNLPFHLDFNIPLLKIRDLGFIVLAAAVAAVAVLIVTMALALPLLCPDGAGSDRCPGTDGEIKLAELTPAAAVEVPAQAASVAMTAADEIVGVAKALTMPAESRKAEPASKLPQFRPVIGPETRLVKTIVTRVETPPAIIPQDPAIPQAPAAEETAAVLPALIAPVPEPAHKRPASTASEKRSASIQSERARPTKAAAASSVMIVGGSGVTVRSGPSRSNGSLFALSAGEKVAVIGTEKGWLNVKDSQGRVGWAYSRYLR